MLVASLGVALASELGLAPAGAADEVPRRLTFGALEPLADLIQQTPGDKLLPLLVEKLRGGLDLKTLTAAAALANARAFGGNDYTGYHTFMALAPAYQMAQQLPDERRALPVLKVVYRNAQRIQETGHARADTLQRVTPSPAEDPAATQKLLGAIHNASYPDAEAVFAAIASGTPGEAFQHVQWAVMEEVDVHRVVLAWRSWSTLSLTGQEHAHTLLRQSIRYCVHSEDYLKNRKRPPSDIRLLLPRLLDEHRLTSLGNKTLDDAELLRFADVIYGSSRQQAAEAVAAALAEGISPAALGEAMSLAANQLVLHDPGRKPEHASAGKPPGGVHGDSVGVHASDAANAWRNIAAAGLPRQTAAALIVGAYHTAGQTPQVSSSPYVSPEQLESVRETKATSLLAATEEAIRSQDQARACALVQRYGEQQHAVKDLQKILLKYATSEDGALHAEKYYHTACEEFDSTRPALRWRQMVALARVTASEFGYPAPGYVQACELLGVS
jgi:hypothetical protein